MEVLRSVLQPITHNLPPAIRTALLSLLGSTCYKTIVLDIDPRPSPCLNLAVSKSLGVAIITASAVVKIPQILKLLSSQSAAGVSFLSYVLETASYAASLAYNVRHRNPFSTYGETALIAAQNIAISVLVLRYQGRGGAAAVFVAAVAAAGYALLDENVVSMKALGYAQAGAGVLGVASKVPQILTVWKEGSTGQLSAFAVSHLELLPLCAILSYPSFL
jgi:mannose-P-dolichol utilization defect protein 1